MGHERPPLAQDLTSTAREEGIERMRAHLSRRSGRERSREDARAAFENLLGFFTEVSAWKARADREARQALAEGHAPAAAPRSTPPRGGPSGRKAAAKE